MQRTVTEVKITTKHVSNRPVTFVAYKRFAVLFVLPSCCVNPQICRAKSGIGSFSFTLTLSLSPAVTSRQVLVSQLSSAFIEKLFSVLCFSCLARGQFYKSFFAFPNKTVILEIHEMLIPIY